MAGQVIDKPLNKLPTSPQELEECLRDPEWRIFSGCLYKIMVKGDDDDEEADVLVMPFKPNRAQKRFLRRLWHRNIILKARQLGFTTLIAILWLDHALFNANQRCGIIAQTLDAAGAIFRDKVQFAYKNLPPEIRERFPLAKETAKELLFAHNNSSIRVSTSMRSGTIHRLHISEMGKICAESPKKAKEVMTGSIPAVPKTGILVIESTAEGPQGEFYRLCVRAQAQFYGHKKLTSRDYRFHFYAWWQEPNYVMDPAMVDVSREYHDYFDSIEVAAGCTIDSDQRAWYVATQEADFPGEPERMWQEYPSTPEEAFQRSTKGHYLTKALTELTKRGGITRVPLLDLPVYTFWDIGRSDGCAIWFMQELRGEARFIAYYEEHDEDLRHYVRHLQERGYVYGVHFLPHDAAHKRLSDFNKSVKEQLQELMPGQNFVVVPIITRLMTGISLLRKHLKSAWFDREGCDHGLERLRGYKKKYSTSLQKFIDEEPDKSNGCTEAADALRQWAQAKENGLFNPTDTGYGSDSHGYQEPDDPDWRT